MPASKGGSAFRTYPGTGWLGIVFLCEYRSGEAKPDGREVDRAGFYRSSDLDRLEGGIEPWSEWVVRRVLAGRHSLIPMVAHHPYSPKAGFF
jgi:NADH pyrophosphatase NudC (nudix superfamily)